MAACDHVIMRWEFSADEVKGIFWESEDGDWVGVRMGLEAHVEKYCIKQEGGEEESRANFGVKDGG
jgi:hypothetical protein